MRLLRRNCLLFIAALTVATPATAQEHAVAAGYGAGFIQPGAFNPGVAGTDLSMDAGWVITIFGEGWHIADGRVGARLNGAFTRRPLQLGEESRDIAMLAADASIVGRLLPATPDNTMAPFVSVGGGIVRYGLGRGVPLQFPESGVVYPGESEIRWALVGGAGVDIMPAGFRISDTPLGIRIEVANHMVLRSPIGRAHV